MDDYGSFEDQVVQCRDCGAEFVFSAGEQAFFEQKGFAAPPKRCKSCRDKKKSGGDFAGGGGGGGGERDRSERSGPPRYGRSSGPVEVHQKPATSFRPRDSGGGHSSRSDSGGG